jgi:hypothetical protein
MGLGRVTRSQTPVKRARHMATRLVPSTLPAINATQSLRAFLARIAHRLVAASGRSVNWCFVSSKGSLLGGGVRRDTTQPGYLTIHLLPQDAMLAMDDH